MTSSLLDQLVEYRGIESNYHDAWGRPTSIEPATKSKLLYPHIIDVRTSVSL